VEIGSSENMPALNKNPSEPNSKLLVSMPPSETWRGGRIEGLNRRSEVFFLPLTWVTRFSCLACSAI
ncbi:MAG: hypothetical protein ACKOBW_11030, partial [Planctomycetota bacterium]